MVSCLQLDNGSKGESVMLMRHELSRYNFPVRGTVYSTEISGSILYCTKNLSEKTGSPPFHSEFSTMP